MKELVAHRTLLPSFERYADKVGFHDGDYHGTFGEAASVRLADSMHRHLGIGKGDRFAIMACNSHQYLELYHAAFLSGAVANPLNLRLAGKELQFILADSDTEVVFVDSVFAEHFARNIAEVRRDLPIRQIVHIDGGDGPRRRLRGPGRRRAPGPDRARRGRPGRPHVHGRHHGTAEGRAARLAGRDAEPVPHRHRARHRRLPGVPPPDPDVPRRLDGCGAGHPRRRCDVGVRTLFDPRRSSSSSRPTR